MGRRGWALTAALAVALGASGAAAQSENLRRCRQINPEASVPACTAIIDSPSETDANRAEAYYNRGVAHMFTVDYDRALPDLDQAIRLRPTEDSYWVMRGMAYDYKDQNDRAIQDFDQAIRVNPSSDAAFNARGAVYQKMERYDRAIEDFDQAIRLKPSNTGAFANRCLARAVLDRLELALNDCNEALRLFPAFTIALVNRGLVHLKAGRYDAAIADYDASMKPVRMTPAIYGRGLARQRKGDAAGGAADIAEARKAQRDIAEKFAKYGVR